MPEETRPDRAPPRRVFFHVSSRLLRERNKGHRDNTRSRSATEEDANNSAQDDAHQDYRTCHLCALTLTQRAAGAITEGICGCLLSGAFLLTNFGQLFCCTENNPHPMLHTMREVRQLLDIVAITLATNDACPLHSSQ